MNPAIRSFIEANYQPWRVSPKHSLFRGPIGADAALPLSSDALKYYEKHGIPVEGRLWEEVMEGELLGVLKTVVAWLEPAERRKFDQKVAFGTCATHEPNACAMRCLDGYAILFDHSFDTLLISSLEFYCGTLLTPRTIGRQDFAIALNTLIATDFLRVADWRASMAYRPRPGFPHREVVDKALWMLIVFLLGHEAGHILLDHLARAPERAALFTRQFAPDAARVLQPAHQDEFDADRYAVELLIRGHERGGLVREGADPHATWQSTYCTLGWLFTVLGAIEALSVRAVCPVSDSHPGSAQRWERIASQLRRRVRIDSECVRLDERLRSRALEAARSGPLPEIRTALLKELDEQVALPESAVRAVLEPELPPLEVFNAWINAGTLDDGKSLLERNPGLLRPEVDAMHLALAEKQPHPLQRDHILRKRLALLQRCREVGIELAFAEVANRRPIVAASIPEFEVPAEDLKAYGAAMKKNDSALMAELVASRPQLRSFINLPDTAQLLVNTRTPAETRQLLENHSELFLPAADGLLARMAASQQDPAARRKIEAFRVLLAKCREVGIAEGIAEMSGRSHSR